MGVQVPLGEGTVDVELPDCSVTVAEPPGGETVDVRAAAERAVADPAGPRVTDLVSPDDTVAIVVTDVTRATPDEGLVDVLLSELQRVGIYREQVTVVVGLGLHRPMTARSACSPSIVSSSASVIGRCSPRPTTTVTCSR